MWVAWVGDGGGAPHAVYPDRATGEELALEAYREQMDLDAGEGTLRWEQAGPELVELVDDEAEPGFEDTGWYLSPYPVTARSGSGSDAAPTPPQAPASATHVLFWEPDWPGAEYGLWRVMPLQDWEDGAGYDTSEATLETIPGTEPSAAELLAWLHHGTYRYTDRHHDGSSHERDLPMYTVTTRARI